MWKQVDQQQNDKIFYSQSVSLFFDNNFPLISIIIFQFTAMILYSFITLSSFGLLNLKATIFVIIGMFASFCWCARFTGALLNPAVVVSHMIRKEKPIRMFYAIVYIIMQFAGSFVGAFIAWQFYESNMSAPFTHVIPVSELLITFARQIIGCFFYTLILLILISTDITFAQLDLQIYFALSISLTTICQLVGLRFGINPAFNLSFQFWYCYFREDYTTMRYCWVGIVGPFLGAVLGSIFFQFAYRPIAKAYKDDLIQEDRRFTQKLFMLSEREREFTKRVSVLQLI